MVASQRPDIPLLEDLVQSRSDKLDALLAETFERIFALENTSADLVAEGVQSFEFALELFDQLPDGFFVDWLCSVFLFCGRHGDFLVVNEE